MDDNIMKLVDRLIEAEAKVKSLEGLLNTLKVMVDAEEMSATKRRLASEYYNDDEKAAVVGELETRYIKALFGWKTDPETQAMIDAFKAGGKA